MRTMDKVLAYAGMIGGLALFFLFVWYIALPLLVLFIIIFGIAGFLKRAGRKDQMEYPRHSRVKGHEKIIDVEFTEV